MEGDGALVDHMRLGAATKKLANCGHWPSRR
jgi:hypothetical protein